MDNRIISKEIDWFCYHAVSEGLLDAASRIAVLEAIEEAKITRTIEIFIQVITENQLCSDTDRMKALADMSREEAKVFGFPTESVFDKAQKDAEAPAPPRHLPNPNTKAHRHTRWRRALAARLATARPSRITATRRRPQTAQ